MATVHCETRFTFRLVSDNQSIEVQSGLVHKLAHGHLQLLGPHG